MWKSAQDMYTHLQKIYYSYKQQTAISVHVSLQQRCDGMKFNIMIINYHGYQISALLKCAEIVFILLSRATKTLEICKNKDVFLNAKVKLPRPAFPYIAPFAKLACKT